MRKLQIFFAKVVQCDRINHFAAFGSILYVFFLLKNGEKLSFLFKNGLPHASYDVISCFHSNRLSPNLIDKGTATENGI